MRSAVDSAAGPRRAVPAPDGGAAATAGVAAHQRYTRGRMSRFDQLHRMLEGGITAELAASLPPTPAATYTDRLGRDRRTPAHHPCPDPDAVRDVLHGHHR